MSYVIEKSHRVLQELEEEISRSKISKIKAEVIPLSYSPSEVKRKPHQSIKIKPTNSLKYKENNLKELKELMITRKQEFNQICDS